MLSQRQENWPMESNVGAGTVLITQPKSAIRDDVRQAVEFCRSHGCEFRVLVPFDVEENEPILREAVTRGARRVIAGGGDGTVNATVNSLMALKGEGIEVEMGVLPLGTANDFARGMGLPLGDLGECLRTACTAKAEYIDIGKLNQRYFANVASLGFGAEVTASTPLSMKKALGGAAYSLFGFVKAQNLEPYACRVDAPGEKPQEGRMLFMAVGNNRYAGGGYDVAPKAKLSDGKLDLAAITVAPGFTLAALKNELDNPGNPGNRFIRYGQRSAFTISSETELHCNLDGEPMTSTIFDFSIVSGALPVAGIATES